MLSRKLLTTKGQNLVCNELAMLKIVDDVSETLFNELEKVRISLEPEKTRHQTVS